MTQASAAPAPAPAAPVAPAPAAGVPAVAATPGRAAPENVPALLNRWQVIAVATCLVFGVLAALLQLLAYQAGERAAGNTEQLVRIQGIQASLLRANALATNGFLTGGLEPTAQRDQYDASIDQVLTQVAEAAEAQPADRDALAAVNRYVSDYTNAVTQARDNNRQLKPIGSEYLLDGSATLTADAGPVLASLVAANTERAQDELGANHPWWLLVLGMAAIVVLWWIHSEIARRFRRRVNQGIALAVLVVTVLALVSVAYAARTASDNDELLAGDFATAVLTATSRSAANDAKANESLRLIKRGSGAVYEERWEAAASEVDPGNLDTPWSATWVAYRDKHAEVVELDDGGQWEQAVLVATSLEPDGGTFVFDQLDQQLQVAVDQAAADTTEALRSNGWAPVLVVLTLLGGLAAAAATSWGINQRRREYA